MKSHVGMGYTVCPVCAIEHTPEVLLHTRLKQTLTNHEFMGWGMCPEHQKLKDEGYVALVETSNEPTGLKDAIRTGVIVHVKSEVWPQLFNVPIPPKGLCFVQPGVAAILEEKMKESS